MLNKLALLAIGSGVTTLGFAIWAHSFSRNLTLLAPDSTAQQLHTVRKASMTAMVLQFAMLLGGSVAVPEEAYGLRMALFSTALVVQGLIQQMLEGSIRKVEAKRTATLLLFFRGIIGMAALYAAYWAVFEGGTEAVQLLLRVLGASESLRRSVARYDFPVLLFVALGTVFMVSPLIMRWMMPSRPVTDPRVLSILESCFRKAGLAVPAVWTLELDHIKSYNAMVVGLKWGRGPFRQALFFSRGLLDKLSLDEFEAIMLHEVSHIALGHIRKRLTFAVLAVLASIPVIVIPAFVVLLMTSGAHRIGGVLAVVLFGLWFQVFLMRRQVRFQELEADANAVVRLGAAPQSFSNALVKVAQMNDELLDRKSPESYLNAASAHPTFIKRIEAIAERVRRSQLGQPIFTRGEWISDLFEGKARYVTLALLAAVVVGGVRTVATQTARHQLRTAVVSGDTTQVERLLDRGADVNGRELRSFGSTPLHAAAGRGDLRMVRFLAANGADVGLDDAAGRLPLETAVRNGHGAVAHALLELTASPQDQKKYLDSMLLVASAHGHLPLVQYFIFRGADINVKDRRGSTPLALARHRGFKPIEELLVRAGARIDGGRPSRKVAGENNSPPSN